jgi:hypothetical protein
MLHNAVRASLVVGLVVVGWVVGHAQAPAQPRWPAQAAPPALSASSDFELLVSTNRSDPKGTIEVRCVRGCRLTWAPTVLPANGSAEYLAPDVKVVGVVTDDGCVATGWNGSKNCHILGWTR